MGPISSRFSRVFRLAILRTKLDKSHETLFPLFLKLSMRPVLLVGGGAVATSKALALAEAGARLTVVSPQLTPSLAGLATDRGWPVRARAFSAEDLEGMWLVVAAAPPAVNAAVAAAADAARIFVVAVDDPPSASAYGAGIVRRAGVTLAISTAGQAPALAGLVREGLDELLPAEMEAWLAEARRLRPEWRAAGVAMAERRPLLLQALNRLYERASPGGPRGMTDLSRG